MMRGLTSSSTWVVVPADVCERVSHPAGSCGAERKHYRQFSAVLSAEKAKIACEASSFLGYSGGFATIRSAEEQAMVERLGFTRNTMIGGSDPQRQGIWRWVGDNALIWNDYAASNDGAFTNFYPGKPNYPNTYGHTQLFLLARALGWGNFARAYVWVGTGAGETRDGSHTCGPGTWGGGEHHGYRSAAAANEGQLA